MTRTSYPSWLQLSPAEPNSQGFCAVIAAAPTNPPMPTFGAHPENIEIGCGGSMHRLIKQGWRAVQVCVTTGEAGSRPDQFWA